MVYLIWILVIISVIGVILQMPMDAIISAEDILALVGICTTLIVGINIYNAMSVRKLEIEREELHQNIRKIEQLNYKNEINIKISNGLAIMYIQPYNAFLMLFKALYLSIERSDTYDIERCIQLLEMFPKILGRIKSLYSNSNEISETGKSKITTALIDNISNEQLRNLYQKRLQSIIEVVNRI